MDQIKTAWQEFVRFLSEYDVTKIMDMIARVDWQKALSSPFTWLVLVPVLGYLILRRHFRILLVSASVVVFLVFVQTRLPAAGEAIPVSKLMEFLGVAVLIIAVNIYYLFMREK
ncbi:MAG TPA: hypothetical protein PLM79_00210 [Syntrophobacteraceae bacterium]|nr:hypothetical protein [Syntrophobacteraceae bacterium]